MHSSLSKVVLVDFSLAREGKTFQSPPVLADAFLPGLLRQQGVILKHPHGTVGDDQAVYPNLEDSLIASLYESTAALALGGPSGIWSRRIGDALLDRIRNGLKLWIAVPQLQNISWYATQGHAFASEYLAFLGDVGVELTNIGLSTNTPRFDHPRSISLRRQDYPAGFRHPELLRGVSEVVFNATHALRLHREAQSIAAFPLQLLGEIELFDRATDYAYLDWNEPDIAVMSASYIGDEGGCVIVSSGLATADPYRGPTGCLFPGGESNRALLQNLIRWLAPSTDRRPSIGDDVHRVIQSIERNLLEFVEAVLGPDWPHHVDPARRAAAEARRDQEKSAIDWIAYLHLSDHIATIGQNIERFRPILEACGLPSSKKKLEKAVLKTGRLLHLRILDSHETKRVVMGHEFAADDLALLTEIDRTVIRLCRAAAPPRALPAKTPG